MLKIFEVKLLVFNLSDFPRENFYFLGATFPIVIGRSGLPAGEATLVKVAVTSSSSYYPTIHGLRSRNVPICGVEPRDNYGNMALD